MNGRLIAIGDIHGCHAEFAELLDQLAPTKDDRLILLGDLVNRGPDSPKVIDLARAASALSLLGNHELRLLNYRRTSSGLAAMLTNWSPEIRPRWRDPKKGLS